MVHKTAWRNGSAFDSRSKGCVFESRRGQQQADPFSRSISSHVSSVFCRAVTCCPTWGGGGENYPRESCLEGSISVSSKPTFPSGVSRVFFRANYPREPTRRVKCQFHHSPVFQVEFQVFPWSSAFFRALVSRFVEVKLPRGPIGNGTVSWNGNESKIWRDHLRCSPIAKM